MASRSVPIYILTGFLGSGKTSVLLKALEYFKQRGKKAAVIINEFGDVDIDGQLLESGTPIESMLGGCICCTVRGDIGLTVLDLYTRDQPDVLLIEATGAADSADLIEGITDATFLVKSELRALVTVVDALLLADMSVRPKGKTIRLLKSQIRSASWLILSKTDLISAEQTERVTELIREWNPHAPIVHSVRGEGGLEFLDSENFRPPSSRKNRRRNTETRHDYLSVMTIHLDGVLDRDLLEQVAREAKKGMYRMKGIARFSESHHLFLIQYAYGVLEILPIRPQKAVQEALVLIGEMEDILEAKDQLGLM